MHQNQVGQNLQPVKKSFPKYRKSFKEMPDLQFVILHEGRHITSNGSPYFEEPFESLKRFLLDGCHMLLLLCCCFTSTVNI